MRMSYIPYLRAAIHQGTDRMLLKKKKEEEEASRELPLDIALMYVCVSAWSVGGGVCVFARQNIISCFFSSPLNFPALGRELYFRKQTVWKYPGCLGKIYHACLFFVQEWIWQSHN